MTLQLLGYAASILIATSLLMRSIVRLRVINMAGAATFAVYGFLIGAYPVGILNSMTTIINLVQLLRLQRREEIFRILEVRPDAQYLRYFLEFERDDIRRFIPAFRDDPEGTDIALFVLRDLVPAGVLLGRLHDGELRVLLDYVVPQYRDMKVGRFLFVEQAGFFRQRGIRVIASPADTAAHSKYLTRMGFVPDGRMYRLTL
jgi:GNAT superfamily N-acetyltransferase